MIAAVGGVGVAVPTTVLDMVGLVIVVDVFALGVGEGVVGVGGGWGGGEEIDRGEYLRLLVVVITLYIIYTEPQQSKNSHKRDKSNRKVVKR